MTIAIDTSPLKSGHYLQHRVRGTGFYLKNLRKSLLEYYPDNKYIFFNRGENLSEADVVHYPYFEPFFLTLPFSSKSKRVVTVHDLTPLVFPQNFKVGLKGKLKWQIQKQALKNTNAIITDSVSSKKDIVKYTGISDANIHVVYLAASKVFKKLEKSSILSSIREKYDLPEKFVLYVGDATWNKNLPRLIRAVTQLNISLVMVGKALIDTNFDKNNSWNRDLTEIHKLAVGNKKIIRLGFVPTEDLIFLYNASTVFAMPSLYEGFGLPILEAMSCGSPVVTSCEGSIPEIAGEASFNVDAYSVDSISQGIKDVFNNQNIQKSLSSKGIVQSRKFTWYKTAEQTMAVYKKVL